MRKQNDLREDKECSLYKKVYAFAYGKYIGRRIAFTWKDKKEYIYIYVYKQHTHEYHGLNRDNSYCIKIKEQCWYKSESAFFCEMF